MPFAVITIDKIDKREAGYLHFKCKAQKAWNCNVPELVADLAEGERYKIDYNETQPSGGRKYGSKYINRARVWQPEDGENTWPDKEPYTGGSGGGSYSGGKSVSKQDYDPEIGKRQTAANCATQFLARQAMTVSEFAAEFPVVAGVVLEFVNAKSPEADSGTDGQSGGTPLGSDADIAF